MILCQLLNFYSRENSLKISCMYDDLTGIISFMKVTNHYVLTNDWHQV